MAIRSDEPKPYAARESAEFLGKLVLVVLLAVLCVLIPITTAQLLNPWVGILMALGSFWVWIRFGPSPMPGFLSGFLCLCGHAAILCSVVWCVALALR